MKTYTVEGHKLIEQPNPNSSCKDCFFKDMDCSKYALGRLGLPDCVEGRGEDCVYYSEMDKVEVKPTREQVISILEDYNKLLIEEGLADADIYSEPPLPIDLFLTKYYKEI